MTGPNATSPPSPAVEGLTAEQATAEIAKHRAGPIAALPPNDYMTALYQKAYGTANAPSASPPASSPSPAPTLEAVPALRAEQQKLNEGSPRFVEISKQIEAAYKAAYPEPVNTDERSLKERYPVHEQGVDWDEPGITAMMAHAPSDDARTAFHGVLGEITGALMVNREYTADEGEAILLRELQHDRPKFDAMVADGRFALAEAARLGRQAWVDDLEARGFLNTPRVVKALAELGAKLRAGGKS